MDDYVDCATLSIRLPLPDKDEEDRKLVAGKVREAWIHIVNQIPSNC